MRSLRAYKQNNRYRRFSLNVLAISDYIRAEFSGDQANMT